MKYRGGLPEHNDNISHEHPLKDFMLILAGLSAAVLVGLWVLGLLVDRVVDGMSPATETRLTRLLAPELPVSEAALRPREARVQALVDSMRRCAGVDQAVTVRLSESGDANAVVIPGATIIVYSGLYDHVESENGLAFILAHELSHLAHRDHLRAVGRGLVLITAAALLTGDGSWAASVLAPAQHLGDTSYSRGRESAADARALQILQCRYGHVGGATEFFTSLRRAGKDTPVFADYLSSHPSASVRLDSLQAEVRAAGLNTGPVRPLLR